MQKIILCILFLCLISCVTHNPKELSLFNNYSFQLNNGDELETLNTLIQQDYQSFVHTADYQIPLFRFIKQNDSRIFIALPFNANLKQLSKNQLLDTTALVVKSETDSVSFSFRNFKCKTTYLSELIVQLDKNLLYILAVTDSQNVATTDFNKETLLKRIIKK